MKVKIVIQTIQVNEEGKSAYMRHAEVWSGELDILPENEYLTKLSLITDGVPYPICDVPFSLGVGHYMWIPPVSGIDDSEEIEAVNDGYNLEER